MRREDIEAIRKEIDRLRERDTLVVVEGRKDAASLKSLGITHVMSLGKAPLYKVAERIAAKAKDVALLTDLDREGRMLFSKLKGQLSQMGVRIDVRLRETLFRLTAVREIEGLASFLRSHERWPDDAA